MELLIYNTNLQRHSLSNITRTIMQITLLPLTHSQLIDTSLSITHNDAIYLHSIT